MSARRSERDTYGFSCGPAAGLRLTRDAAIEVLTSETCAPITRTVRGIRSEVELGPEHGLPEVCIINEFTGRDELTPEARRSANLTLDALDSASRWPFSARRAVVPRHFSLGAFALRTNPGVSGLKPVLHSVK